MLSYDGYHQLFVVHKWKTIAVTIAVPQIVAQ